MNRIFAFHLLNDYSGSPKVLGQLLKGWVAAQHEVHLHTSASKPGFLTEIEGIHLHNNHYRFYNFIPIRLILLLFSQLFTLLALMPRLKESDIVYVNTILPFGAAIAGKIRGARVIYHIHETSVNPLIFKQFLLFWVKVCANEVIYVSDFLANEEPLNKPSHIMWNTIEDNFMKTAIRNRKPYWKTGRVLMVASLKRYKGVDEFVTIAKACPEFNFDLVVNASVKEIVKYFSSSILPRNLTVHPAQQNIHPFYQRADVVMNLSRPDEWKETFGLTALEAMAYGLPVIVPPVGGIAEIVHDCLTGFHFNGKDTASISHALRALSADPILFQNISRQAILHANSFTEQHFLDHSLGIIEKSLLK